MQTATAKKTESSETPEESLARLEAEQVRDEQVLADQREELREIYQATSAYRVNNDAGLPRHEALRLQAREPVVRQGALHLEAAIEERRVQIREARRHIKLAKRAEALEQLRRLLPKLNAALAEVEAVMAEIRPLDLQAFDTNYLARVTLGFEVLLSEPRREGLIAMWRRRCRAEGFSLE